MYSKFRGGFHRGMCLFTEPVWYPDGPLSTGFCLETLELLREYDELPDPEIPIRSVYTRDYSWRGSEQRFFSIRPVDSTHPPFRPFLSFFHARHRGISDLDDGQRKREREKERPGGPSNKVIDRTRLSFWIHFFQRIVRELRLSSKRSNLAQALLLSRSIKLSPFTLCFFFSLLFIYQWVIYFQGIQGFKHFSYIGFTLLSSRCGGSVISFYVSYDLGTFCIEKIFVSYKRPRILILLSRDGYHVEKFRRNLFARVNKQNEKCSSNEFSDKLVNRSCRRSILLLSS